MVPENKQLQLIQLLRGIASILVVLLHIGTNSLENLNQPFLGNFFKFGGSGVDIFFVLSGFIITYTSKSSLKKASYFFTFLRRRFVRIFPVYWVIISIFLLLQLTLPSFYRTPFDLNIINFLYTYLLLPDHVMINGVSWTLTNELYFYFLFALAFLIRSKKFLLLLAILNVILIVFQYALHLDIEDRWVKLVLNPMNVEFFMGIGVALSVPHIPLRFSRVCLIFGTILFLISAIASNNDFQLFNNNFNRVVLFGIPSSLIILGVVKYELSVKINMHNALLLLGEASYSLYLLHLPIIAALAKILLRFDFQNPILINLIFIFLIILICTASIAFYILIEKPLIRKLNESTSGTWFVTKKENNIY